MIDNILHAISPTIHNYFKQYESVFIFLIRFGILYFIWEILFHFIWKEEMLFQMYSELSLLLINSILECCSLFLGLFNIETEIVSIDRILKLPGTIGVTVGEPCIGYDVTALYVALIMSCKGAIKQKLWFIPMGVIIIFFVNVVRISALALLVTINQEIWELNHKLIFTIVVYVIIFLMWRFWLNINLSVSN